MDAPALLGTINNTTTASSYVSGACTPTNATKTIFALVTGRRGTGAQSSMQPIVIQIDGQTLMNALVPVAQRYTNRTGRAVFG